VDPTYPPEADAYRDKIRAFLGEHLPADWRGIGSLPAADADAWTNDWRVTLFENGLVAAAWPKEYGGGGLTPLEQVILAEEFARAGVPSGNRNDGFGIQMVGNTILRWGTEAQKEYFLPRIISGEHKWCQGYSEPGAGSDLAGLGTRAVLDGDEWVINGEKWFSSHARYASFLIVLAVTDPDEPGHRRMSMFVVPIDTPGVEIIRNVGIYGHPAEDGTHAYMRYTDVRIPADHLLGERGGGFVVAQTRLGGGRIHHAMRTVGLVKKAFDAMCERALSRETKGEVLGRKQLVQAMIADSWIQIEQFRLLVLRTAWKIDRYNDYLKVRADISAVKAAMPQVLHDVASRALQIHGSLGVSNEMPFGEMVLESFHMGLADGPTEVHKTTLARQVLKDFKPTNDLFPTTHLLKLAAEAENRYSSVLEELHTEAV
jgi:acyl-CoA dehydrogenase